MMSKEKVKGSAKKKKAGKSNSGHTHKAKSKVRRSESPTKNGVVNRKKKKKSPISPSKGHRVFLFIWNFIFYVLMLSLLVGSSLMAMMQQQDKALNGYRMFGVLTNSMVSPDNTLKNGGFRAGDMLIIKEVADNQVKVGDVITYRPSTNPTNKSTNFLTHRVAKIEDHLGEEKGIFFTTRGDANRSDDMPISARALVGKVTVRVPKIGGILAFVKENWFISLIFMISIIGFIWVIRIYILNESGKTHNQKNRKAKSKTDITLSKVNINKTHTRRKHE
ncbi:signal peptidase I [Enterococcus haemoperoxidus ATCC BAA-382]|uniref:Signal peptidase I n=2 Tax=Enterococcus haemoperoxidus TaxID=155618 RepID=R2T477_9ENTE|nr:signal peptidase I [Enterococcus haemoperoxidus ATCC BAA-382]EOT60433.1 signal peptidase I [Enterococcus haemoperoxidus ATCC BAA-382]OJG54865.1 signal peptidase I [Enterococcus haemoperoxidus]